MINLKDSAVSIPLQKSAAITLTRIPFSLRDTSFNETLTVPFVGAGEDLRIYPNPASDVVTLEGKADRILVRNVTGQLILEKVGQPGEKQLHLGHLPAGLYLLQVYSGNSTYTHKLILNPHK